MNKTIFIAAVLAATTLLEAGSVVFLGSIQEAQANPCYTSAPARGEVEEEFNCIFEGIGSLEIAED